MGWCSVNVDLSILPLAAQLRLVPWVLALAESLAALTNTDIRSNSKLPEV